MYVNYTKVKSGTVKLFCRYDDDALTKFYTRTHVEAGLRKADHFMVLVPTATWAGVVCL
jgi:hypothetical protein